MAKSSNLVSTERSEVTSVDSLALLLPTVELGRYWQPVLDELAQHLNKVVLYTGRPWPGFDPSDPETSHVEVVGKTVRVTNEKEKTDYSGGYMLLSPEIINRLLQFRPQVVITSGFSIWTLLTILLKPIGGWKIVLAWEGSSPSVDFRNSKPRLLLRRVIASMADTLITNGQVGKAYLTDCLGVNSDEIQTKPYMVPDAKALLSKTQPSDSLDLSATHPIFLYVGRLEERKGMHFLLKACKALRAENLDFTLLVVGKGPEQETLEQYCKENDLEDFVNWLGWVAYDNLGLYFQSADVFVFPSLEDTWGMVVLEAMAFGLPILCSKWAGASEMVTADENGYLFDPHSPETLSANMKTFIRHPELIESMGNASHRLMQSHTPATAAQFFMQTAQAVSQG